MPGLVALSCYRGNSHQHDRGNVLYSMANRVTGNLPSVPRKGKTTNTPSEIGRRARALRERAGLKQDQASEITGIPQKTISAVETGQTQEPAGSVINKLADAYDALPEEFYPGPARKSLGLAEYLQTPPGAKLSPVQRDRLASLAGARWGKGDAQVWYHLAEAVKRMDEKGG